MDRNVSKVVGGIVAILVCCSCALIVGAAAIIFRVSNGLPSNFPVFLPPGSNSVTAQPTPALDRTPVDSSTTSTLETLRTTIVPENDPYDLA